LIASVDDPKDIRDELIGSGRLFNAEDLDLQISCTIQAVEEPIKAEPRHEQNHQGYQRFLHCFTVMV
jgi:hypothetical protein